LYQLANSDDLCVIEELTIRGLLRRLVMKSHAWAWRKAFAAEAFASQAVPANGILLGELALAAA
jgi:hypothetical protein